jgi:poly(A) polymerase
MAADPHIIPASEHPITPEMIDDEALFVLRKLNQAGFSSYLVGGGVRDLYLGKTPKDFDIGTDARPGQIRRLFANSRTIGRRFRLVQVFFKNRKIIEVSTLRSLSEHDLDGPGAVLAPNNTYGTVGEDAQRRDISINALFYEIENHTIIDHVGGVEDLDRCVIRIIGDPDKRITHDPVRMMRVIRHSARNNFIIEEASWASLCRNAHTLTLCPPSRLRDELLKDLYSGVSADWFDLSVKSSIFGELFGCYKGRLSDSAGDRATCLEQLQRIFATIDNYNNRAVETGTHRQPDYFVLALILIPWAILHFDLDKLVLKGPQLYQLVKQIREELNRSIGQDLNLRKSTRQEITTLLAHLPILIQHCHQDTWPKWLKKKSYFSKCKLFYYFYCEAFQLGEIPPGHFSDQRPTEQPPRGKSRRRRSSSSKKKGRPAFVSSPQGSIFGFKR